MTTSPLFPGFDGLLTLSRREGVDIRPTLLRVLTDLYVQAHKHTPDEERQFIELTSRLIDDVDDATRAAVRARLAIYPGTPDETKIKLGLKPARPDWPAPVAAITSSPLAAALGQSSSDAEARTNSDLSMQPADAAEISDMFFRAGTSERIAILQNLADNTLKAAPKIPAARAEPAIEALEMAAFVADVENFTLELGETLILPARLAAQIVNDPGGEPLVSACKALGMSSPVFQRVLLFLKPEFGSSVQTVYRLSRLYDRLGERSALVMLAAWRGSTAAVSRARYRPVLHDDERQRVRAAAAPARPAQQPGSANVVRLGTQGSRR
jgi:hypothetical protein